MRPSSNQLTVRHSSHIHLTTNSQSQQPSGERYTKKPRQRRTEKERERVSNGGCVGKQGRRERQRNDGERDTRKGTNRKTERE